MSSINDETIESFGLKLVEHLHSEFFKVADINEAPEEGNAIGFQIIGYHEDKPVSGVYGVGRKTSGKLETEFGVTVGGNKDVAEHLWKLGGINPGLASYYTAWSVQDAIDNARFLIETTANFQRFANMTPNVGGEVDIIFISKHRNWQWVQKKSLTDLLVPDTNGD